MYLLFHTFGAETVQGSDYRNDPDSKRSGMNKQRLVPYLNLIINGSLNLS